MRTSKFTIAMLTALFMVLTVCAAFATWIIISPPQNVDTRFVAETPKKAVYVKKIVETTPDETVTGSYLSNTANKKLEFSFEDGTNASSAIQSFDVGTANSGGAVPNVEFTNGDEIKVGCTYSVSVLDITFVSTLYSLAGTYQNRKEGGLDGIEESSSINIILKHKTVQIGNTIDFDNGTWYTIEDALGKVGANDTIVLWGDDASGVAQTAFTGLTDKYTGYSYTTSNNHMVYDVKGKIRIPFANVDMDYHGSGGKNQLDATIGTTKNGCDSIAVASVDRVYSTLFINKNIELNIYGNLIVGGLVSTTGTVSNRGVVMNDGLINVKSTGKLGAYGYIKDGTDINNGEIIFENGSKGIDVFKLFDWRGGASSAGYNSVKMFPVNAYSAHNISCKATFYAGATYEAFWTIQFGNIMYTGFQRGDRDDSGKPKDGNAKLIGKTGDSAMFILSDGYIVKTTDGGDEYSNSSKYKDEENALKSQTGSNQNSGQRDIYTLYGTVVDGTISLNITANGTSFDMKTSTDMALPISYMNIVVGNDEAGNVGEATLKNASYKFFPGTSLTVQKGASLNIEENATIYLYSYDDCVSDERTANFYPFTNYYKGKKDASGDAYLKINGTMSIGSSASLGGNIISDSEGALLDLSGNSQAKISYAASREDGTFMDTITPATRTSFAHGILFRNGSGVDGQFASGKTYKYLNNVWCTEEVPTVVHHANGGTFESGSDLLEQPYSTLNDWQSTERYLTYELISQAEKPTRPYYEFLGWATSPTATADNVIPEGGSTPIIVGGQNDLYAVWKPVEYAIEYIMTDDNGDIVGDESYSVTIPDNFGAWDILRTDYVLSKVQVVPQIANQVFFGWYNDKEHSMEITVLDTNTVANVTISENNVIKLYGWIGEPSIFDIQYVYDRPLEFDNGEDNSSNYAVGRINGQDANVDTSKGALVSEAHINNELIEAESTNDTNSNRQYYFLGWFDEIGNRVDPGAKINSSMNAAANDPNEGNRLIVITAKWAKKARITISDEKMTTATYTGYHKPGNGIIISTLINIDTLHSWDYDVDKDTYFTGEWTTNVVNKVQSDGSFTVPTGDGAQISIQSVRATKVTLTVHVKAKGEDGEDSLFGTPKTGNSRSATARVTFSNTEQAKQSTATGKGGVGDRNLLTEPVGQTEEKEITAYLKPGQTYNVEATVGSVTDGSKTGEAEAGHNIEVTVSNGI